MSENLEYPASWCLVKLGDIVEYGKTEKVEAINITPDSLVVELEDIEKDTSTLLQRMTFAQRQSKSTKNRFFAGDVLYGKLRPYLNKVVIADENGFCSTEILPLRPNDAVKGRFLFYWLKHPAFLDYVISASHGLNMPRLGTDAGIKAPILLAPVNEQRRIADKLDALLKRVDACREKLDRVPLILKRFRQAVLAAATSGALTEDWREGKNPGSWKEKIPLKAIIESLDQGWSPKCAEGPSPSPDVWGVIKTTSVQEMRFLQSENKRLPEKLAPRANLELTTGDLLITRAGPRARAGVCCLVREIRPRLMACDKVYRFRLKNTAALPEYIEIALNAPAAVDHIDTLKTGISESGVNLTQSRFLDIKLNLPSLGEQQEIVRRAGLLFDSADRLNASYLTARKQIDQLTPSLLAKAFRGELVEQDPNDEPASVLLERIRAERIKTVTPRSPAPARSTRSTRQSKQATPPPTPEPAKELGTNIPQRLLAAMQAGRDYGRAEITAASGISDIEWSWAIKQLKEEGKVRQTGERRGARYRRV